MAILRVSGLLLVVAVAAVSASSFVQTGYAGAGYRDSVYYRPDGSSVPVRYISSAAPSYAQPSYSAPSYSSGRSYYSPSDYYQSRAASAAPNVPASFFRSGGDNLGVGNYGQGDVAVASPYVMAVVGDQGRADIRPEAVAHSGSDGQYGRSSYGRSGGQDGSVAVAQPHVNAIVGYSGSLSVAPKATALSGYGLNEGRGASGRNYYY